MGFRFKKFEVSDDSSTMKVGTDAILLGTWVNLDNSQHILDIGTGCGIIALILAQRSSARIHGIDIASRSTRQAMTNGQNSPWSDRLSFENVSLNSFVSITNSRYDLIVTNPPFFTESLQSPKNTKNLARHDSSLSLPEILMSAERLLTPEGRVAMVIPGTEFPRLINSLSSTNLSLIRILKAFTKEGKHTWRALLEISLKDESQVTHYEPHMNILDHNGAYSPQYRMLTADFYLDF